MSCSPRPGSGRGAGGEGKVRAAAAFWEGIWGCLSLCCDWVCADTTLTPRPPLPPAGEGEKRARARASCTIFTWYPRGRFYCFAPLAPGRGEGPGVRGKTAQRLLLGGDWAVRKALRRLGLRGHHPHPPPPSPASGRGGKASSHALASLRLRQLAICVRKALLRLGLRGHHPHPPAPSPASGRGGAACALARVSGVAAREFWGSSGGIASGGE